MSIDNLSRRASYQENEEILNFSDACRVVNMHANEVGSKVKKLYQLVSDETNEELQEKIKTLSITSVLTDLTVLKKIS